MTQFEFDRERILKTVRAGFRRQVGWRRRLHRHPEISFQEHKTTAFIKSTLEKFGLNIIPTSLETGVLAELRGSSAGPTVAIRSDIDALPIQEQTNLPFASKVDGCMHACGHDMHMATVLGVAAVLCKLRSRLCGNVRFIFQPAEEMPPGGALPMIEAGALREVDVIFGLHVDPHLKVGRIGLRDGVTMASVTDFDLIVHGVSGHAARPHDSVDAIAVAAEVIESVQKIVSREIDPTTAAVITFGSVEGGLARNVIADRVVLKGTARALSQALSRKLPGLIRRTANGVCRAHGARLEMNVIADYPVLSNHSKVNRHLARYYHLLFGDSQISETEAMLGGEDFARYLKVVPGAMFRLGVRNAKIGADKPWHSPKFVADEEALICATSLLVAATMEISSGGFK